MSKIEEKPDWAKTTDRTLELLDDREWHTISELRQEAFPVNGEAKKALHYLDEIGIIEFNEERETVKISDIGVKILDLPRA